MESILTIMGMLIRIQLADETEASSAEEQLARDSQLKVTNCRWDGSYASAVPLYQNRGQFGAFLCLIKPYFFPCQRQGKSNNKNRICPFHADPVHYDQKASYRSLSISTNEHLKFFVNNEPEFPIYSCLLITNPVVTTIEIVFVYGKISRGCLGW